MTALEFYRKHLHALVSTGKTEYKTEPEIFEQAKEMEKEQIMNAWNNGQSDGATICTQKADNPSEEYYNKTFKSE